MRSVSGLLREAQEKLSQADHLAFTTYPQLKEPKLLALVVENANVVFQDCMEALLAHDRMFKRISPSKGGFREELEILRSHCFRRYGIPDRVAQVIADVKHLADKRRSCAMEFRRRDNYVLCSKDYNMDKINIRMVRGFVDEARKFLGRTSEVLA